MAQTPTPEAAEHQDAETTRPQQAGEAATTRFGMEDGDNTDVPATGGPHSDEEEPEDAA
jgi:hypothetical protein